jgi:hypothetical protein
MEPGAVASEIAVSGSGKGNKAQEGDDEGDQHDVTKILRSAFSCRRSSRRSKP